MTQMIDEVMWWELVCWIRTYVFCILASSAVFKYRLGEAGIAIGFVDLEWISSIPLNSPAHIGEDETLF